ncbi:hypothetical protein [Gloeocapsa sp. PCC 73106]|uniref:hypothetical protein n=1 Tax=Gloeocapsa sp. PCC 73106 TaxID=102232 RepID=UPI0002ABCA28|nr:hypothetical protein [Gloeocapsa sp. PCC 73106]ELR97160.1 hypothetical protein GLO73106DRAFT_00009650 [Gloeocapsa sp. PCC 73106]
MTLVSFYHGTDVYSALDILNNGLNSQRLLALQKQPVQLGVGWYASYKPEVAWFFASLAPGGGEDGCTVIEMLLSAEDFNFLVEKGDARIESIANVKFVAEQVCFSLRAFEFLNYRAEFKPYQEKS